MIPFSAFMIPLENQTIQPVEKIIYGDNSTKRYRNILRHELELKIDTLH